MGKCWKQEISAIDISLAGGDDPGAVGHILTRKELKALLKRTDKAFPEAFSLSMQL